MNDDKTLDRPPKPRVAMRNLLTIPTDPMERELFLSFWGSMLTVAIFIFQLIAALAMVCINPQSMGNFTLTSIITVCASVLFFLRK
jgi:hypothetical protein